MSTELEPLDADVLSLLRAARPIADLEPAAKAAILASVEAAFVLPPPHGGGGSGGGGAGGASAGSSALASAGLSGARAIAAIAATFAIGVATGLVVAPSVSPRPMTVLAAEATTAAEASPLAALRASAEPSLTTVAVRSLPSAVPTASAKMSASKSLEAAAPSARGLGAERSLLDIARAALARGEGAEALAAVDRHGREYPDGALVEEREALAIKALVALGRRDEARARAARFEQHFPNGLMLRAVKGAIGDP